MKSLVCVLSICLPLCLVAPLHAQETVPPPETAPQGGMSEGLDLLGQGAQLLFRGLMSEMEPALKDMGKSLSELEPLLRDLAGKIDSVAEYHMPEVMPNGDIIIRRKEPLPPPPVPEPPTPDPEAEIEI